MPDPIVDISKDIVSKSVKLSREISASGIVGQRSGEDAVRADVKAQEILKSRFFPSQYKSVNQMLALSEGQGVSSDIQRNAKTSLKDLSTALFLANPKMEEWLLSGQVDQNVPTSFEGISKVIAENWLMSDENDTVGKEIVKKLNGLERINKRAAMAPSTFEGQRQEETKKVITTLCDIYDGLDPDSDGARKLGAVVGYLDDELKPVDGESATKRSAKDVESGTEVFKDKLITELDVERLKVEAEKNKHLESEESLAERMEAAIKRAEEETRDFADGSVERLKALYNILTEAESNLSGEPAKLAEIRNKVAALAQHWIGEKDIRPMDDAELREFKNGVTVEYILFDLLKGVESTGRDSTDLTYNTYDTRKLDLIARAKTALGEKAIKVYDENGELLSDADREWLSAHIQNSLLANDWCLAASVDMTVEDRFKTSWKMHQGDTDGTMDYNFLSHYLDKENELASKSELAKRFNFTGAFDLRQQAYHAYIESVVGNNKDKGHAASGYLFELWGKYSSLLESGKIDGRIWQEMGKDNGFLYAGKRVIKGNPEYRVMQDYYNNFKTEAGTVRGKAVKKLMELELLKLSGIYQKAVGEGKAEDTIEGLYKFSETNAGKRAMKYMERSVEISRRLHVIFYADSLADLSFNQTDEIRNMVNFKLWRYRDQVEAPDVGDDDVFGNREAARNKPTGSAETIKYIDALAKTYIQALLRKEDSGKDKPGVVKNGKGRLVRSETRAEEIDFKKMATDPHLTQVYQLGSILMGKQYATYQAFIKGMSAKDFWGLGVEGTRKRFDQFARTISEMASNGFYALDLVANGMDEKTPLRVMQQRLRYLDSLNMLKLAEEAGGVDWGRKNLDMLNIWLVEPRFYSGKSTSPDISWISENQRRKIMDDNYRPEEGGKRMIGYGLRRSLGTFEDQNIQMSTPPLSFKR